MGKGLFNSKTFYVNLLTGIASVAGYISGHEFIASNPDLVAIFGAVVAVANIVLRVVTKEPIKSLK